MDVDQSLSNVEEIEKAFESLTLHSNDSSQVSNAVAALAEASRSSVTTREQLADPKVLRVLIELVECSLNDALETVEVALRCIGNACIDNEAAKAEVTKYGFSWAKQCLPSATLDDNGNQSLHLSTDTTIAMLTAKVLYNICSDCEPAQQECFQENVHHAIFELCVLPEIVKSDDRALFIELFFWICGHVVPDEGKLPRSALTALLTLPGLYHGSLDIEDHALIVETCLLFLRENSVKHDVVEWKLVFTIWQMLRLNETRLAATGLIEDDRRILRPLSTSLIWILSDVAAAPEFASKYSLDDDLLRDALFTIQAIEQPYAPAERLVDAACQIVGNLLWARKDTLDYDVVEPLQQPILKILKGNGDAELLHSAAGLTIQLLRLSPQLRGSIGSNRDTEFVVQRLCKHEMPQMRQDGIALLRLLGKESPENQTRFADLAREVMSSSSSNDVAMLEA